MNRIKELREELGVRQSWLANKLHLTQAAVSKYELGERDPSVETILELCSLFDCSADYLLGLNVPRHSAFDPQDAAMLAAYKAAPYSIQSAITVLLSPYIQDSAAEPQRKKGGKAG